MNTFVTVAITIAVYFVFSAAAGAMLPPEKGEERTFYGWFYRFSQHLAANADRVFAAKYPALAADISGVPAGASVSAVRAEIESISTTK